MILTLLNLGLSLAPTLAVTVAVTVIAVRHQRLFLATFMVLTALESTRDFAPSLSLNFSGTSVYPEDLVMLIGAFVALPGIGHWRLRLPTRVAVLILATLVGLGVVSWISTYGLQLGTNSWRPQMLIVALLLYTTTRPRAWSWKDLQIIILGPAMVAAFASVAGILLYGLGSSSSVVQVSGVMEDGRPILASGSLLILAGLWVAAFSPGRWDARRLLIVGLLGSTVLLTQNRSVWIASILGLFAWWIVPRIPQRGAYGGMSGVSRSVLIFFVGASTALVGLSVAALGQSASNGGTFLWRVARWADSMTIPRSRLEWLFGSAFGPTPASSPKLFLTSAHSLYVNSIEMTGFIGLLAVLTIVIAVGRAHVPPSIEPLGLVLCFSFLSFGVTYQMPPWAWMTAGILLASGWAKVTLEEQPPPAHGTAHHPEVLKA